MKILESLFGKLLLTGLACCCFSWIWKIIIDWLSLLLFFVG